MSIKMLPSHAHSEPPTALKESRPEISPVARGHLWLRCPLEMVTQIWSNLNCFSTKYPTRVIVASNCANHQSRPMKSPLGGAGHQSALVQLSGHRPVTIKLQLAPECQG
ncbi:hypothetical protein RRG08_014498 [Elysia crispata]|uniref:Uncharacterized protein n=1 Tax=Elysia crispata TaxID=231223 RepID=A0AAE1AUR1_9GAST|nr:hypothetical protein RRG08_014498 [Elysia crispata]